MSDNVFNTLYLISTSMLNVLPTSGKTKKVNKFESGMFFQLNGKLLSFRFYV